jgi:peptidoglycan hydrolase-like protein with peptidoglycan-binding domain
MIKAFGYILIFLIVIVMFFSPARNYVNNLLHREKKEVREEEVIGKTSGYNPRVEEIQTILKETGLDPGPADGVMGAQTRVAIKEFQKAKGLKPSGKVDPVTQLALNRLREVEKPPSKAEISFGSDLDEVVSSDKSRQIQTALKNSGFYKGEVDGKIGPKTKAAIRAFQKASNLNPDGVVGSKTWDALKKNLKN